MLYLMYVIFAAAVLFTCSQQHAVDVLAAVSLVTCSAAAVQQIYSTKTEHINIVMYNYHTNPSKSCHDRNIYIFI